MRDKKVGQKSGRGSQKRAENHFHFFIEMLLEYITVNETRAFGIYSLQYLYIYIYIYIYIIYIYIYIYLYIYYI